MIRALPSPWIKPISFCTSAEGLPRVSRVMGRAISGEAGDRTVLARRMQGFSIRFAKRVNRDVMRRRRGTVLDRRYHARVLATPSQVRNAIAYVLFNHAHHVPTTDRALLDPYSSARIETHFAHDVRVPTWAPGIGPPPVTEPSVWLLRAGYRRAGRIANPFVS